MKLIPLPIVILFVIVIVVNVGCGVVATAPHASPTASVVPIVVLDPPPSDPPVTVRTVTTSPPPRTPVPIINVLDAAASEFGVDRALFRALAFCESSHRPDAVGDNGAAVGLFQFHLPTWRSNARLLGYDDTDRRTDPVASSRVAAAKIAREGLWAWKNCAERIVR